MQETSAPMSQECLKKVRKMSHPELEISLYLFNFSKEVGKLAQEILIYLELVYNITGMSPKNFSKIFRKTSQSEQEISLYLSISVRK